MHKMEHCLCNIALQLYWKSVILKIQWLKSTNFKVIFQRTVWEYMRYVLNWGIWNKFANHCVFPFIPIFSIRQLRLLSCCTWSIAPVERKVSNNSFWWRKSSSFFSAGDSDDQLACEMVFFTITTVIHTFCADVLFFCTMNRIRQAVCLYFQDQKCRAKT